MNNKDLDKIIQNTHRNLVDVEASVSTNTNGNGNPDHPSNWNEQSR